MNRVLRLRLWNTPGLLAGGSQTQRARTRADRRLARRVAASLDGLEMPHVESASLYVRDAHVTVFGLVSGEADRQFILDAVSRVPGVESVGDHMQLVAPEELEPFRREP